MVLNKNYFSYSKRYWQISIVCVWDLWEIKLIETTHVILFLVICVNSTIVFESRSNGSPLYRAKICDWNSFLIIGKSKSYSSSARMNTLIVRYNWRTHFVKKRKISFVMTSKISFVNKIEFKLQDEMFTEFRQNESS